MTNIGYYDDEDNFVRLPSKWVICDHCRGEGKSSSYLGAMTCEDLYSDPEFAEDYLAGRYDRACDYCNGSGKIKVVDVAKADPEGLKRFRELERMDAEYERERYNEWLFEGGWRELGWR